MRETPCAVLKGLSLELNKDGSYASLRVFCGEDFDIISVNTGWGLLHPAATPASASTSLRLASSADKGGQRDSHHSFRT